MNINEENLKLAKEVEQKDGSLGNNFYEAITEMVQETHQEYANHQLEGDKKNGSIKMAELNGTVAAVDNIKEINKALAGAITGGDMSAWNDNEHTKDHKDLFNAFMKGDTKISKNKEGDIGVNFNGKFHTMNDIENKLGESKKDFESIKEIRQHVIDATNLGKEDRGLKEKAINNSFNEKQTRSQLKDIVKKGNIKSLLFDPVLDGAPFVDEILEMPELKNVTYKSLGLKPPKNDDDGMINETLTSSDAKKIASSLAEEGNQELAQELLTDYFTKIVAQNNKKASGSTSYKDMTNEEKTALKNKYLNL